MNDIDKTKEQLINELGELRIQISELRKSSEGFKESEEKFKTLAEQSPNMIFINKRGRIVYTNKKCEEVMGYTKDEFYSEGFNFLNLMAPEHRELTSVNFSSHMKGEEVLPHEYTLLTKNGERIDTLITTKLIHYDGDGAILGIITDIADLKKTETMLKESEHRYRDLYDKAPDMYHTLDRNGIIIDCNETEAKMLGYPKEEMIGRHITDFFTEDSKKFFTRDFPSLNEDKPQITIEREFVRKDGTSFPASLSVFSEYDEDGKLIRAMTIARDITDRKRMETELLKIEKLESLGILAGGIAHDFNNILTAILGSISLAKLSASPGAELYERLSDAEKASMRARDLTQQLLTFSKGGIPVKKTVLVSDLIKESAKFALRGSDVRCDFYFPEKLWQVDIDEGQISQVINNLIINADQAMPQGGTIEVKCENITVGSGSVIPLNPGRYVKISVKDHGIGIASEHLTKIFDPFFTTKQKGSGLGLSIVYSIIKKHDGYIFAESKISEGTTFHLYLPASSETAADRQTGDEDIFYGKGKILVMDDEESIRQIIESMLERLGYKGVFAREGSEAIELYRKAGESQSPFDAVIMDLTVPGGIGGKEAIHKLRDIDPKVKAVVSSGYLYDNVMANYKDYGFVGAITKPFKFAELSRLLHEVVSGNRR